MGKTTTIGPTTCSACHENDTHKPGCPNEFCVHCGGSSGGHHATCIKATTLDGTTGEPIIVESNGRRRLEHPPALTDAESFAKLQAFYEAGEITGVKQPKASAKMCEFFRLEHGQEVGCGAFAVFRALDEAPCPECEKMLSKKHDYYCIAHMALKIANQLPNPQTKLFADPEDTY